MPVGNGWSDGDAAAFAALLSSRWLRAPVSSDGGLVAVEDRLVLARRRGRGRADRAGRRPALGRTDRIRIDGPMFALWEVEWGWMVAIQTIDGPCPFVLVPWGCRAPSVLGRGISFFSDVHRLGCDPPFFLAFHHKSTSRFLRRHDEHGGVDIPLTSLLPHGHSALSVSFPPTHPEAAAAMSDVDDELLALAGGDVSDDASEPSRDGSASPPPPPSAARKKETSSKAAAAKKAPAKRTKNRSQDDESEEEEGEASSVPASPSSQQSAPMEESDSDADSDAAGPAAPPQRARAGGDDDDDMNKS
ncbi:hypothetical protein VTK73DRAFT_5190 [Phialemonium thermophilum]|uniref:Uncharacterized protein n=1 Tax=Phialemonium thermophilum TaxID=223376 RepID=A0ABR3V2Y7_9PEZI